MASWAGLDDPGWRVGGKSAKVRHWKRFNRTSELIVRVIQLAAQVFQGVVGVFLGSFWPTPGGIFRLAITASGSASTRIQLEHTGNVTRIPAMHKPVFERTLPEGQIGDGGAKDTPLGMVRGQMCQRAVNANRGWYIITLAGLWVGRLERLNV